MSTQIQGFDEWPQLLTVDQLVKLLQLPSKETIYYWNKYGKGPSNHRVGRYIRYKKTDVLKWLEDQQNDW
jgi:predicted DNA-binding transcriptional regulator AlpA